jgi:hypothetical protein
MFHINNTKEKKIYEYTRRNEPHFFKMQKENQGQLFIDAERKSSEDEERNLYCVCGELKTACPDGYAHTTGGA